MARLLRQPIGPMFSPLKSSCPPAGMSFLVCWLWVSLGTVSQLFGSDWPQWRGPNRAADWTESGIVKKLPQTGLKVLWRAPIGLGFSSPVIVDGNVYVMDATL